MLSMLRIAYRAGPQLFDPANSRFGPAPLSRSSGAWSIGISNLPGLAYWGWRLL
jgi:hypothetical protein